eukprot:TRINITY_DN3516_c0_g1_i3.p1 TRINITY_DN3516_c0_g1~~TRINITY_DN3516_c0_g1_i3.p1  ORF type:complete len:294 (-),score=49.51 TRINITY_DN3516_c0_g1_i3:77-907(-)
MPAMSTIIAPGAPSILRIQNARVKVCLRPMACSFARFPPARFLFRSNRQGELVLQFVPLSARGSAHDENVVVGIILGGGAGTRLYPLTRSRAKPAVPLGANYRLIDIPVSNCINSNIRKIYIITQYKSDSLNGHLSQTYASGMGEYTEDAFVEVLSAMADAEQPNWFKNCTIRHSVLGLRSTVEDGAVVEESLIMGADYYEVRSPLVEGGGVPLGVGRNSRIRKAIIDKNVRIGSEVQIINADNVQESLREDDGFCIRSGIVVILKSSTIAPGTII